MCHCSPQKAGPSDKLAVDVSPEVIKSITQADLGRRNASNGKSKESKDADKQLSDQMVCQKLELSLYHGKAQSLVSWT